jgi:hypothetical protein
MIGDTYSDGEARMRALFAMPHIHSHGFLDYTNEDLQRCTACQQDREGYLNTNHYVDEDGKAREIRWVDANGSLASLSKLSKVMFHDKNNR